MGARKYGIYLRVFNRYLTLSGKRNSISTSKHVLFCYHINATAPYQIEKSILSMNQ